MTLMLILATLLLFLLPLLPGILEVLRPTDIAPLKVSQAYDSNPYHFAEGFRSYIRKQFIDIHSPQNQNGALEDDTRYQLVGEKGIPNLDATNITNRLLLTAHPLTLPANELFETEIYSTQTIFAGERSHFRAILAGGTLHLKESSSVLRWAHSDGEMAVGRNSRLFGRATSGHSIILGDGVQFERLHAPRVMTTFISGALPPKRDVRMTTLTSLDDVKIHSGRRWILNGALDFPRACEFDGDIITGSTAVIGDYAHIKGSIKCNAHNDTHHRMRHTGIKPGAHKVGACEIGDYVEMGGSLVSSRDLYIGKFCRIFGPVIAEGLLVIGAGTVIGSPEQHTTVTAQRIIIEGGCTIYGTLWAEEGGIVRTSQVASSEVLERAA